MAKDRPRTQRSHSRLSPAPADRENLGSPAADDGVSARIRPRQTGTSGHHSSSTTAGFLMDANRQDALVVEEVGDCWLRSRWTISSKTQERAASAMGREGHKAIRVLRLHKVEQDDSGPRSKELHVEFELPGSAEEWFTHIPATQFGWVIEIGLVFGNGRFFSLLHSVPIMLNGTRATLQGAQRFLGGDNLLESFDAGDPPSLAVQGTFLLNGTTVPGSRANIDDQPVPVDAETGRFDWKLPLTNGRVVVPINVVNFGKTQRALLSIDLNFHLLEPEPSGDH